MPAPVLQFTLEECDLIRALHARGKGAGKIRDVLNKLDSNAERPRTFNGVRLALRDMGLGSHNSPAVLAHVAKLNERKRRKFLTRGKNSDRKFKLAMLSAMRIGAEKAIIGVVKDRRPLIAHHTPKPELFSGCSSAAAVCAELGGANSSGTPSELSFG